MGVHSCCKTTYIVRDWVLVGDGILGISFTLLVLSALCSTSILTCIHFLSYSAGYLTWCLCCLSTYKSLPSHSFICKYMCRYGPFWICTTLIFVAAAIGTFVTYLAHKWPKKEWDYDINLVTWSAGLFYGYVTIVPVGLYVILKYFSAPAGLIQLLCLYGYSLFVFIPASVSLWIANSPYKFNHA